MLNLTLRIATGALGLFFAMGCATSRVMTPQAVSNRIQKETGYPSRDAEGDPHVPVGVVLEDGLAEQEAVAIALWNNSGFQESLADLGIARADLVQAGLLRNPVLSLLFPWGPKHLLHTLTEVCQHRTPDGGGHSRRSRDLDSAESAAPAGALREIRPPGETCAQIVTGDQEIGSAGTPPDLLSSSLYFLLVS
jgi:hypothetical protein